LCISTSCRSADRYGASADAAASRLISASSCGDAKGVLRVQVRPVGAALLRVAVGAPRGGATSRLVLSGKLAHGPNDISSKRRSMLSLPLFFVGLFSWRKPSLIFWCAFDYKTCELSSFTLHIQRFAGSTVIQTTTYAKAPDNHKPRFKDASTPSRMTHNPRSKAAPAAS